ncbi:MAG TPA: hypothetical protein RMH99_32545 [Sandaracinaceae bacterium LLY-WYZ-13_1]|nr:hypothetical protein [Sandaracinaceae bacterium LLY-WYZ-13_1]
MGAHFPRSRRLCTAALLLATGGCGARGGLDYLDRREATPADAGADARDADRMDAPPAVADGGPPETDAGPRDAGPDSDIGDPCDGPSACRSAEDVVDVPACIGPGVWPNGHLWEDGYCTAQCTPSSAPGEGEPLARDDCPPDALCVPFEDGIGVCLLACEDDDPCRPSDLPTPPYACRRSFGDDELPVGVCVSSHCTTRGCPGSARCDC